jgi:ribosomal protein L37E
MNGKHIVLRCPRCGKKAGRVTKEGRTCVNCGYVGKLEEFIEK